MAEGKGRAKWIGIAVAAVVVVLAAWGGCSCDSETCAEELAGTWQGSFMNLTFTFPAGDQDVKEGEPVGQLHISVLGMNKSQPLAVQECSDDKVVFTLGDTWATAVLKNSDTMSVSQSGLPAAELKRIKK
jgi:hypothetical protein